MARFASTQKAELRQRFALGEDAARLEAALEAQGAQFSSALAAESDRIDAAIAANSAAIANTGVSLSALAQQVAHNRMDVEAEVVRLDGRVDAIDVDSEVEAYLDLNLTDHLDEILPEPEGLPATIEVVTGVDFGLSTVEKKRLTLDARGRITAVEDVV